MLIGTSISESSSAQKKPCKMEAAGSSEILRTDTELELCLIFWPVGPTQDRSRSSF
jgi:hypothetical protein